MSDLDNMRSIFQMTNIGCLEYRDVFRDHDGEVTVLETSVLDFDPENASEKIRVFNIFDDHGNLLAVVSGTIPRREK